MDTSDEFSETAKRRAIFWGSQTLLLVVLLVVVVRFAVTGSTYSVVVEAPDRRITLNTKAGTVKEALGEAGLCLSEGDTTEPAPDEDVTDGMVISVLRAAPVFLSCDGTVKVLMTTSGSVSAVIEQACVELGPDDYIKPSQEEQIPSDGLIRVVRVTFEEEDVLQQIPFRRETRNDSSLEAGLIKVSRSGRPGSERVTYSVRYEDGQEVSREEIGRNTIKDPAPEVVLVGIMREVSRGGQNIRFKKVLEVVSTAYCPCAKCCGKYANGLTHTGMKATKGVIAVDPRVIPLGTRVYVDGYGFAVAADTGGAIKGSRIDVCYDTHTEALAWGMKKTRVFILE